MVEETSNLPPLPLPASVSSRYVNCPPVGLKFHYLEASRDANTKKPLLLLLHGYPELAFSWRKVMCPLADAGYHVVAPDQRGYGRTTGWDIRPWDAVDLNQFTSTSLVRDIVVFVYALGYDQVHCVVGHDFGAVSASLCALMRPDLFKRCVLMSHTYRDIQSIPFDTAKGGGLVSKPSPNARIAKELAALPEPKKHYRNYNSSKSAAEDWLNPQQGLKSYLRGYVHVKSADWGRNKPHPLLEWTGAEMAKMPYYYVMPAAMSMPEVVTELMRGEDGAMTSGWLSDADLDVYVQEWSRTGFQGGLNWYRTKQEPQYGIDLLLFAGRKLDVPTKFISGVSDWGNHQEPGALQSMETSCSDFRGSVFIEHAGHWPQQEQPEKVIAEILRFVLSS